MLARRRPPRVGSLGLLIALCLLCAASVHAQRRTLFTFGAPRGALPGALVRGGDGALYGATLEGGAFDKGAVFMIGAQGQFRLIYSFTGAADGMLPSTLVAGRGSELFGVSALAPNLSERAVLFRLNRSGALSVLHTLDVKADTVLLAADSSGVLYAATQAGDVVAIDAAGALRTVYTFGPGDYATTLVAGADGNLYGTTSVNLGNASLFRLSGGGEFKALASFAGATEESGAELPTALTRSSNGTLYVATGFGQNGALYRLRPNGSLTHIADLEQAPCVLVSGVGGEVYGAMTYTGAASSGTIFQVAPNGRLSTLHEFAGAADGSHPTRLAIARDALYGITMGTPGNGTLFRIRAQRFTTLLAFDYPNGQGPNDLLKGSDGALYGTTQLGGPSNAGVVFKSSNTGEFEILHAFDGSDGARPTSLMEAADGNLYGRTSQAGSAGFGTLFRLTRAGELSTLANFSEFGQGDGPALVQTEDGALYGVDRAGSGHIFRAPTSGEMAVLYTFPNLDSRDGFAPTALVRGDASSLYGTTQGAWGPLLPPFLSPGTIFRLSQDGTFATLYAFEEPRVAPGAAMPRTMIRGQDGKLYGITPNFVFLCPSGTLWRFDPESNTIALLHAFTGRDDGADPATFVEDQPGVFYGMTLGGQGVPDGSTAGACEPNARNATLFQYSAQGLITLETLPFSISPNFVGTLRSGVAKLIAGGDGKLYGVITNPAAGSTSELFAYDLPSTE